MCMGVLPVCVFMHDICAYCLLRPEEGVPSLEAWVTDGSELPSRCWELKLGLPEELQVFLTAEPSLQLLTWCVSLHRKRNLEMGSLGHSTVAQGNNFILRVCLFPKWLLPWDVRTLLPVTGGRTKKNKRPIPAKYPKSEKAPFVHVINILIHFDHHISPGPPQASKKLESEAFIWGVLLLTSNTTGIL